MCTIAYVSRLGRQVIQVIMKLVDMYSIWAGVEKSNKPFVCFSSLVCLTKGKKGEFGEDLDLRFIVSNSFSSVVGGFKGARDNHELSNSKGGKELFRKMSKTCSLPMSSVENVSFSDRPKIDTK